MRVRFHRNFQLLYKNSRNDFFRDLSDDRLLNLLDKYFLRHLEEDLLCFDLKSELSTISFAIAETSDRLLIRSTLVSGLIGGIIGFLLSLL